MKHRTQYGTFGMVLNTILPNAKNSIYRNSVIKERTNNGDLEITLINILSNNL